MEREVTIKWGNSEINFSDLDKDNDIEINVESFNENICLWISKENIISIRDHLDYVLGKILNEDKKSGGGTTEE